MAKIILLKYEPLQPTMFDDLKYRNGNFIFHLELLRELGFESISCQQLIDYVSYGIPLPEHSVLISFDECMRCDYEVGVPALVQAGFRATFFISGECILRSSCNDVDFVLEYMNLKQVRSLVESGFELGLQTFAKPSPVTEHPRMIMEELDRQMKFMHKFDLPFAPVLAISQQVPLTSIFRRTDIWAASRAMGIDLLFTPKSVNPLKFPRREMIFEREELEDKLSLKNFVHRIESARIDSSLLRFSD